MRIHVLSDLHLEFEPFTPPEVEADLVVLAGDIHCGIKGVTWAKWAFGQRPVLYVPSNHECYRNAVPRLYDKFRNEAAGSRVCVLERASVQISGVKVLGYTLWTDMALYCNPFLAAESVACTLNDFKLIRVSPEYRRLQPVDTIAFHRTDARWLRQEGARWKGPLVVVTHHAPSARSLGDRSGYDLTDVAYASMLEPVIEELPPAVWIHGHIHRRAEYTVGKTRVVCNPSGYPHESENGFDPGFTVDVDEA